MNNKFSKSFMDILAIAQIAFGFNTSPQSKQDRAIERLKQARPCLECGRKKIHNNAFCTKECCKKNQKAEKEIRTNARLVAERLRIERHMNSPCFDVRRRSNVYGN